MTPVNRRVRLPEAAARPSRASPELAAARWTRWGRALRAACGAVLVAGTSVGVAWIARRHVMTSPRFAVTEIDVTGNDRRSADAVTGESGIALGANVFALDLDASRARILADPWIAQATLARRLPGAVLVQVQERKAAAIVSLGDLLLATPDGEPFKKLEPGDPVDLPLVTGLTPEGLDQDREGTMHTIRRAIDLADEYAQAPLSHRAPLEEIHVGADGAFTAVVGHAATALVLGAPPFRRKLDQAARIVAELDKRGAKPDAIMLDNDARPERVVVRVR